VSVEIPDVAALYLEEAVEILEASGIHVREVVKTLPPRLRDCAGEGRLRVVLVEPCGQGGVTLVVTRAIDVDKLFGTSNG